MFPAGRPPEARNAGPGRCERSMRLRGKAFLRYAVLAQRVFAGLLALQAVLLCWRAFHSLVFFLTIVGVFLSGAAHLLARSCPFCNRLVPEKRILQGQDFTCEHCGKEIHVT